MEYRLEQRVVFKVLDTIVGVGKLSRGTDKTVRKIGKIVAYSKLYEKHYIVQFTHDNEYHRIEVHERSLSLDVIEYMKENRK